MNTTVHREGDRVWLEGVSGWFVGDRESSVHAAQAAAMAAAGEDITYEYLLGVSGLAFRMQVSKEGLCPSSPHSFCGYQCVARSVQALPWKLRIFEVKADDVDGVRQARKAVVDSIDRGGRRNTAVRRTGSSSATGGTVRSGSACIRCGMVRPRPLSRQPGPGALPCSPRERASCQLDANWL